MKEAPQARIAVVDNGVDTAYFSGLPNHGNRNRIVFVGLMAYHANVDGMTWFTREIWPAVRKQMPDKVLTVVGANPTPEVLELRREPHVEVTGTVPDVRPWYAEAFAAIVPLRVGAGTRLKILESMAAGVPVVSTAVGAEGLDVTHGENILIADGAQEWADALAELQDEACRQRLIEGGRRLVRSRYDWDIIGNSVIAVYNHWIRESATG
jgi:glycosyltransferase involved in cell wall biosynthesis